MEKKIDKLSAVFGLVKIMEKMFLNPKTELVYEDGGEHK